MVNSTKNNIINRTRFVVQSSVPADYCNRSLSLHYYHLMQSVRQIINYLGQVDDVAGQRSSGINEPVLVLYMFCQPAQFAHFWPEPDPDLNPNRNPNPKQIVQTVKLCAPLIPITADVDNKKQHTDRTLLTFNELIEIHQIKNALQRWPNNYRRQDMDGSANVM